jgi:hypothetical protein
VGFRTEMRAAAVALLEGYKTANSGQLNQIYPGRPLSIHPTCAFPDEIDESDITYTPAGMQRTPTVGIRFVGGTFDSEDTVNAQDALIDGFIEYVITNRHSAGANTLSLIVAVNDEPDWTPSWLPVELQKPYYSTVVTLGGEGLFGGVT